jgi:hypothetical protein
MIDWGGEGRDRSGRHGDVLGIAAGTFAANAAKALVCTENLNPTIVVMKPAKDGA